MQFPESLAICIEMSQAPKSLQEELVQENPIAEIQSQKLVLRLLECVAQIFERHGIVTQVFLQNQEFDLWALLFYFYGLVLNEIWVLNVDQHGLHVLNNRKTLVSVKRVYDSQVVGFRSRHGHFGWADFEHLESMPLEDRLRD